MSLGTATARRTRRTSPWMVICAGAALMAVAVVVALWVSGAFSSPTQADQERLFAGLVNTGPGPHGDVVRAGYIACGDSKIYSRAELQDRYERNGIGGDPWTADGIRSLLANIDVLCSAS
ncbi:hypothetical protein [Amycolatopsis jejuensis]|uniref:hypothetical protein n=1 Tax=Amycolatopsis jejuensis TaxID=330084 RepID=UPI0005260FE5|nr:hypothetical protein [Amycolatopsis jejuensis]